MKITAGLLFCCSGMLALHAEVTRTFSLQYAYPVSESIVIDGRLDENAWKKAPRHDKYYVYFNKQGTPSPEKTVSLLLYDAKGIYVGIINYCKDPQKIRRTITTNSHVDIWQDDCAELYFNPLSDNVSYIRYAVNANAALHCMSRDATLIVNQDRMLPGSRFACSIGPTAWFIEAFLPWDDLDAKARPGDLWQFCHIRFAWGNGKFSGATSSIYGSYLKPEYFGYLFFLPGNKFPYHEIIAALKQKAHAPWMLETGEKLIIFDGKNTKEEHAGEKLHAVDVECRKLYKKLIAETISTEGRKVLASIKKELDDIEKSTFTISKLLRLLLVQERLSDMEWHSRLEKKYR